MKRNYRKYLHIALALLVVVLVALPGIIEASAVRQNETLSPAVLSAVSEIKWDDEAYLMSVGFEKTGEGQLRYEENESAVSPVYQARFFVVYVEDDDGSDTSSGMKSAHGFSYTCNVLFSYKNGFSRIFRRPSAASRSYTFLVGDKKISVREHGPADQTLFEAYLRRIP